MKSVSMGTWQLVNSPSQSLAQLPRPVKLNDDAEAFTTAVQTNAQQQLPRVQCSGVYKRGTLLHYISIHPLHYRKMAQKRMDTKLTKLSTLLTLIVVTTTASASATPQKQEVIIAMEISFILSHS
jgi:hypothetical protein